MTGIGNMTIHVGTIQKIINVNTIDIINNVANSAPIYLRRYNDPLYFPGLIVYTVSSKN